MKCYIEEFISLKLTSICDVCVWHNRAELKHNQNIYEICTESSESQRNENCGTAKMVKQHSEEG